MAKFENIYDLEERTACFSERLVDFCKECPKTVTISTLIEQDLRAGTSVGANYCEANGASSKKDFKNKVFICKKEGKETMYWLRLLGRALDEGKPKEDCRRLWQEAKELTLIFSKIAASTKG